MAIRFEALTIPITSLGVAALMKRQQHLLETVSGEANPADPWRQVYEGSVAARSLPREISHDDLDPGDRPRQRSLTKLSHR
jgi:hypothetical protein